MMLHSVESQVLISGLLLLVPDTLTHEVITIQLKAVVHSKSVLYMAHALTEAT